MRLLPLNAFHRFQNKIIWESTFSALADDSISQTIGVVSFTIFSVFAIKLGCRRSWSCCCSFFLDNTFVLVAAITVASYCAVYRQKFLTILKKSKVIHWKSSNQDTSEQKDIKIFFTIITTLAFVHSPASVVVVDLVVVVLVVVVGVVVVVVGLVVVVVVVVVVLSLTTQVPCLQIQSRRTAQSTGNICWQSF